MWPEEESLDEMMKRFARKCLAERKDKPPRFIVAHDPEPRIAERLKPLRCPVGRRLVDDDEGHGEQRDQRDRERDRQLRADAHGIEHGRGLRSGG